jgi:hypothetical protein
MDFERAGASPKTLDGAVPSEVRSLAKDGLVPFLSMLAAECLMQFLGEDERSSRAATWAPIHDCLERGAPRAGWRDTPHRHGVCRFAGEDSAEARRHAQPAPMSVPTFERHVPGGKRRRAPDSRRTWGPSPRDCWRSHRSRCSSAGRRDKRNTRLAEHDRAGRLEPRECDGILEGTAQCRNTVAASTRQNRSCHEITRSEL